MDRCVAGLVGGWFAGLNQFHLFSAANQQNKTSLAVCELLFCYIHGIIILPCLDQTSLAVKLAYSQLLIVEIKNCQRVR